VIKVPKIKVIVSILPVPSCKHESTQGQDGRDPKPYKQSLFLGAREPKVDREQER
jgi:hypothetical protein